MVGPNLFKDVFNDGGPPQVATDSSARDLCVVIGVVTTYCAKGQHHHQLVSVDHFGVNLAIFFENVVQVWSACVA